MERAIGKLFQLTEELENLDVELARSAIVQLIDRIDLYWTPNARGRYRLDRGKIQFSRVSDPASPCWTRTCTCWSTSI